MVVKTNKKSDSGNADEQTTAIELDAVSAEEPPVSVAELEQARLGQLDALESLRDWWNDWSVTLRPSGRVRLTYLGTTPGKIAWASTTLRNVLGFADPVGPLSTGQWAEGEYQPTHVLYAETALDGGWQVEPGRVAGGVMPDGVSYGWQDGLGGQRREVTLRLLPKTSAEALTLDTEATPALAPVERVVLLGADEPGQDRKSVV